MHNSSLLRLLQSLHPEQMRGLDIFLRSPYHNTNKTILKLFQYIRKYHPEMESKKLNKENAFFHLYPNDHYEDRKMRKQMSLLKTAVEAFVTIEQLKENKNVQQRLLIQYYYKVENYEQFSRRVLLAIEDLNKQPHQDALYHQELLWLYEELVYHPDREEYATSDAEFPDFQMHLDIYYILLKLRFAMDFNIRKAVVNQQTRSLIPIQELMTLLYQIPDPGNLIKLYKQLYEFQLAPPDEQAFSETIDLFQICIGQMGLKEKSFILHLMISISITYHNRGYAHFLPLIARLFKFAEDIDLILYQDKMQASAFLNAVVLCSTAKEFVWVEHFIKKYESKLEEDVDNVLNLSWAHYYYHLSRSGSDQKNEFLDKALSHLRDIRYSGLIIDLRLRTLQLRIYYDLELPLGHIEVFNSQAKSFEEYLRRNELIADQRVEGYKTFVKYAKKLAKLYIEKTPDQEAVLKIKKEIEQKKNTILKSWLLEKVEELNSSS